MIIRNAIIITDDRTQLVSSDFDDPASFSGNVVFSTSKLPKSLVDDIHRATGRSSPDNAAETPLCEEGPLLARIAALEVQVEELQKRRISGDTSALGMRT